MYVTYMLNEKFKIYDLECMPHFVHVGCSETIT